ncbi:hypothetical protein EBR66_06780 [bacterium]|nr:hypothetical protein [bacterium]
MRLQIASDLHLETRPKTTFKEILEPAVAPVLALLGDVAPLAHTGLRAFLEWCSEHWETVLWIPGKAELLGPGSGNEKRPIPDLETPVAKMRYLVEPFWNITVLDHEGMVSDDGLYIFGLPFWKFPRDEGHVWHPQFFRYVEAEPSPMNAEFLRSVYNKDLAWIRSKVKAQHEPVMILSHYGPTTWLQEESFVGDPDKSVTFPDIEDLIKSPMVAWVCGHVHQSVQYTKEWHDATGSKGSVLLVANPKGLPYQNLDFQKDAVVRIDPRLFRM